ncbi:MAG: ABC transporter permease [Pseudomonadota bacterium]
MKSKTFTIAWNEWKIFFHTPFAMLIIPLFIALCSIYFYAKLDSFLSLLNPSDAATTVKGLNINSFLLLPFFKDMLNVFIFIIPLITMRTFAEEKKMGNFELLISYPVRPEKILFGKYLGVLTIILLLLLLSFIYPLITIIFGDPYLPLILSTYLGFFLFILMYSALGVYASLLTENQIIAAIITYGAFFGTFLLRWLAYVSFSPLDKFFQNYLFVVHINNLMNGFMFTGDIAMYLCTTGIILTLAYWRIRRHYVR